MKYVFLKDFGGTETGERRYVKGQVVDGTHIRSDFIARGIVALVPEPEPEPVLVPEPEPVSEVTPFVITKRRKRGRSK